jgi:predicted O-methyltransferase YrrM
MLKKIIPGLKRRIAHLKNTRIGILDFAPGHYYSPIVNVGEITARKKEVFDIPKEIKGIDLNEAGQLTNLKLMKPFYDQHTFPVEKTAGRRYYFHNKYYSYSDALFLYNIIRLNQPKRIIEVGSGFSSAVMLDTNDEFFNGEIKMTFVEPHPERLYSLLTEKDKTNTTIHVKNIQTIDLDTFSQLQENDILFIDSTHVCKVDSDVNRAILDILPRLNKGVLIHFHDIFYPFQYPEDWVLGWKGFGWNETYLLKSFLMHNPDFKIEMFNTYVEHFHEDWFKENMPKCLLNKGGSIWIRKIN